MHTTSVSLLARLQTTSANEPWRRFVELYTPLIFYWARKQGLTEADAADLVQDVMTQSAVRVWDAQTGEQVGELRGHTDAIWDIALSNNGDTLASASMDQTCRLWDVSRYNQ